MKKIYNLFTLHAIKSISIQQYFDFLTQFCDYISMDNNKRLFNKFVLLFVILIIISVLGLSYSINTSYTPTSRTQITITNAPLFASFYINNKLQSPYVKNNQNVILRNIPVGKHTLIVHEEGRLPWVKDLLLTEGVNIEVSAFNISQTPKIEVLSQNILNDSNYYETILSLFSENETETISHNETVNISYYGSVITASWLRNTESIPYFFCIQTNCDVTFSIIDAITPITNVAFFPNRDDVIIFSTNNTINAIELDRNGTQNFQPIYTGISPDFVIDTKYDNSLLVKDEGIIMRISI